MVINYGTNYTVQTSFGCSGVTDYPATPNVALVESIVLPDGSEYSFAYETTPGHSPNVTGRIASIALPSGGMISYSYPGSNNGIFARTGAPPASKSQASLN